MSSKKKPAAKSKPAPGPLLKLKFEKFPDKQVPVFFEVSKLCFYADFGFEQYEAASVPQLKQKITAAIKNGATPEPQWIPMVEICIGIGHGRSQYKQALDLEFEIEIDRQYFCIGRGGKLMYCGWDVTEKSRNSHARETYGTLFGTKPKTLNTPIYKADRHTYDGGTGVHALIPYTEQLWKQLGEQIRELRSQAAGLIHHVAAGKIEIFTNFIFDFEQHARARAVPEKKPAEPKKALGKSFNHVREETSSTDPVAKLTSFVNAGRAVQQAVDQAIAKYKPPPARKSPAKKPKPAAWAPTIPDGPLPEAVLIQIGYPLGTKATVSSGPSGAHVDIKPPNHVAMLYSRDWLLDRFRAVFTTAASKSWLEQALAGKLPGSNKQPGPIAELFESDEPARKDKELVNA